MSPRSRAAQKFAITGDDAEQARDDFGRSLVRGLSQEQKSIPSRFFYDARGSALFEEITRLPEYYPTRTEHALLERHASEIAAVTEPGAALIEFGSGSSVKTEILLRHLDRLAAYVAIDISRAALHEAATRLGALFPRLQVLPVVADFTGTVALPGAVAKLDKIGFFPGSTIGNFVPLQAIRLLANIRRNLGAGSRLVIGVDLKKESDILVRAYNDAAGVTAAFNRNLLVRANRELGANFDVSAFEHRATYDESRGCVDMYLVSSVRQDVSVLDQAYIFEAGERIHTEHSYKYDSHGFEQLAAQAGWQSLRVWTDPERLFSVHELVT